MAKQVEKVEFVNPFDFGVTYDAFLKAIPSGVTVEKYCEKHLEKDQLEWLLNDLKHLKK